MSLPPREPPPIDVAHRSQFWTLQLGGWLAFGVAMALSRVGRYPLAYMVTTKTALALLGLVVSLGLRAIYRRLLPEQASVARLVVTTAGASYLAALPWSAAYNLVDAWLIHRLWNRTVHIDDIGTLFAGSVYHAFALLAWSVLYVGLKRHAALQEERARRAEAEAHAQAARLRALQYQLHPHFLFNALNALSTLIVERRTSEASQMLSRVSDFLRHTLAAPDRPEVTLEEELALATLYLEIERVRLGERLDVRLAVPHGIRRARVPSFLLQPLVENAVRHGIAPHEAGGTLLVTAERTGDTLRLVVRNEALTEGDAVGVAAVVHRVVEERATEDDPASRGIGLANTRARLEALYGQRQRLALAPVGPTGAEVIVELPYRETAP
jgi:two-component system, LytTR family, sensor kinase